MPIQTGKRRSSRTAAPSGHMMGSGRWRLFFEDLPHEPDDQAGTGDRKNDACDPAAAHAEQVSDQPADDAAGNAEEHVPEDALGVAFHDDIGDVSADTADDQFDDQFDQHVPSLLSQMDW